MTVEQRVQAAMGKLIQMGFREVSFARNERTGVEASRYTNDHGKQVVLFRHGDWWDVFIPATDSNSVEDTWRAVEDYARGQ